MAIGDKKRVLMEADINAAGGVAPAGFGLGDTMMHTEALADCNVENDGTTLRTGWRYLNKTKNSPHEDCRGWVCTQSYDADNAEQDAVLVDMSSVPYSYHRVKHAGVWGEWEYKDPPMSLGKEYRTTERYQGKPVYVQTVDFGALPNASKKNVAHGISNIRYVCDFSLCAFVGSECLNVHQDTDHFRQISCTNNTLTVFTVTDLSSYTGCYAKIRYTKTTD